jgi:hypothetical protein
MPELREGGWRCQWRCQIALALRIAKRPEKTIDHGRTGAGATGWKDGVSIFISWALIFTMLV